MLRIGKCQKDRYGADAVRDLEDVAGGDPKAMNEARMMHDQKLESLGELAGGLAHDFNNLLSSILGSAELGLLELPEDHGAAAHLVTVRDTAIGAGALCRQLLAYAGKGCFRLQNANLSQIVRDQQRLLRTAVSKNCTVELSLADELPPVMVDVSQIHQVLMNLVVNASEAVGENQGSVRVTTGATLCDAEYLSSAHVDGECKPGRYVFIEVSDDGCGIDEELRVKLFDPFFSTKFAGRGLGLAAVHGIVNGHKGSIRVSSEVDKGSTFKIFFPVSSSEVVAAPLSRQSNARTGSGLVLLVDDDRAVARVGVRMLEVLGFDSIVAHNGEEGVHLFAEHKHELRAVVLDLTMPVMGGVEAFRQMRAIDAKIPVVLTSGFNEQDTVQEFLGKGLAGFLQKPFRVGELREQLRVAVAKNDAN